MTAYRMYLWALGSIVARQDFKAENDADARQIAIALFNACSESCQTVELWQGARQIRMRNSHGTASLNDLSDAHQEMVVKTEETIVPKRMGHRAEPTAHRAARASETAPHAEVAARGRLREERAAALTCKPSKYRQFGEAYVVQDASRRSRMAGKVGQIEQMIGKLGEPKAYPGFSIQDRNGAPLLTLAFETVADADECHRKIEEAISKARSIVDTNGRTRP
jgi:hypothetical protein